MLTVCLLASAGAQAQNAPPTGVAPPYRYCALVVRETYFNHPDAVYLDYGQGAPNAAADPEMAEMAKNISQSNSVIDILNYLSRHRWELFTVTPVQTRQLSQGSGGGYVDSETRYILRRRTP